MTGKWTVRLAFLFVAGVAAGAQAGGEIYGTIYTDRGEEFTGPIRWDRNENFWDDVLDSDKREKVWVHGSGRHVRIFGINLGNGGSHWTNSQFKIQFGHIESIEPHGKSRVDVLLKSGETVEVQGDGSDIGSGMRGLVIYDEDEGEVELEWREVDRITFAGGPGNELDNQRLYGTVSTRGGDFTGFIVWDRDEALTVDILDGHENGQKHKIPFDDINSIERRGSSSSRVELKDGTVYRLSGTNDVDDDNRGIDITIPGFGLVKVSWDEFDVVVFEPAPASRRYEAFDGGRRLYGTVRDEHDRTYTGNITWDLDEAYTWEFLDGEDGDLKFEIPFENIAKIDRYSRGAAEVTLRNGETLVLSGSNDVDRGNKGILIETGDGEEIELDWEDFAGVEFKEP